MIRKSYGAVLTGTSQTVYTVPAGKSAQWVLMYITNTSGSNGSVEVDYYNAEQDSTFSILEDYTITSKDFFQIGGTINAFIMMREGDSISALATQQMTMLVSLIEENNIIQGG
jgi:hypothetical protein